MTYMVERRTILRRCDRGRQRSCITHCVTFSVTLVSQKGDPAQIRIFEMYADAAAYEAHLQTSHFKTYKTSTQGMVKSLVLVETDPVLLGAKAK
jgi:antibiotic biosynthesis monooxygenase